MTSGRVSRVDANSIPADFRLAPGSAGGPVFTRRRATWLGSPSLVDENE